MPVFEVQGPDGQVYEVEAPDEATAVSTLGGPPVGEGTVLATPQQMQQRRGTGSLVNQGIAEGVGGLPDMLFNAAVQTPVNLAASGVDAVFGTDLPRMPPGNTAGGLAALMNRVVPTRPAGTPPANAMEALVLGGSQAAGGLIPGVGAAKVVGQGAGAAAAGARELAGMFTRSPIMTTLTDLFAGGASQLAAHTARNVDPGNPVTETAAAALGGLAGGFGASGVASALPARLAYGRVAKELAPMTGTGAHIRARENLGARMEDPDAALHNFQQETTAPLSPAVQTGDRRLMALEQEVRVRNPKLDAQMREQGDAADVQRRTKFLEPGGGRNSIDVRDFLSRDVTKKIDDVVGSLDETFGEPQGVARAAQGLREGAQEANPPVYNAAYETPIDYASQTGDQLRAQLRRAEDAAPGAVALANRMMAAEGVVSKQKMQVRIDANGNVQFVGRLPDTRQIDYITRALNKMANDSYGNGAQGGQTAPGRSIQNLAREIRDTLRVANPKYAEALDTAAPPIRQKQALDFGKKILSPSMASDQVDIGLIGMTLKEREFAMQGLRSEMDRALANVKATAKVPDTGRGEAAKALKDLSSRAAREKIEMLVGKDEADAFFAKLDEAETALGPSGTGRIVDAAPGQELEAILRAKDPLAAVRQIKARFGNGSPGAEEAMQGLKGSVLEDLLASGHKARALEYDANGNPQVSGGGMRARLQDPKFKAVAEEVLTQEEMQRTLRVIDEYTRLDLARSRLPSAGEISADAPNSIISLSATTGATRAGSALGAGTSGASLKMASELSGRMRRYLFRLTNTEAEKLIVQGISGDRELFEALITPTSGWTPKQMTLVERALEQLFNAPRAATATGTAPVLENLPVDEQDEAP